GRYLIGLARLAGVRTVNVVRRAEMVAELTALGGDAVLLDGPDLATLPLLLLTTWMVLRRGEVTPAR
ncbi:MAG: hypothetical protein ACKO9D_08825, partial [Gammaproteobacteria bacterium]